LIDEEEISFSTSFQTTKAVDIKQSKLLSEQKDNHWLQAEIFIKKQNFQVDINHNLNSTMSSSSSKSPDTASDWDSLGTSYARDLFKGQVVIVTGGATGIGKLTSIYLGNLGAKIAICGRREELLQQQADMSNRDTVIKRMKSIIDCSIPSCVVLFVSMHSFCRVAACLSTGSAAIFDKWIK
jgi:hypothetical protein